MIRILNNGDAEVYFTINPPTGTRNRTEITFPLEVFIALSKTTETLEELRQALFMYQPKRYKKAKAVASE
jgi:hypothetical protein